MVCAVPGSIPSMSISRFSVGRCWEIPEPDETLENFRPVGVDNTDLEGTRVAFSIGLLPMFLVCITHRALL